MERQMRQNQATEVRRPNYNDPSCGKDFSEDDARYERRMQDNSKPAYERRMQDNSKPAPQDEYKKSK